MNEFDAALVRRKLSTITRNLGLLEEVHGLGVDEYRQDPFRRKGTERLLQELVEAAADLNAHLIRATGHDVPATYYESFIVVGRIGAIPGPLAERLAPAAGLRNRIVHEYDELDDRQMLDAVGHALADFPEFVRSVEEFLSERGL